MSKTLMLTLAAVFSLWGLTGCDNRTPAEEIGDDIEELGDDVQDAIDDN
jgi:hypothetical protein